MRVLEKKRWKENKSRITFNWSWSSSSSNALIYYADLLLFIIIRKGEVEANMAENMTENNNFLLRSAIISPLRLFLAFIDVAPSHSPSFFPELKTRNYSAKWVHVLRNYDDLSGKFFDTPLNFQVAANFRSLIGTFVRRNFFLFTQKLQSTTLGTWVSVVARQLWLFLSRKTQNFN